MDHMQEVPADGRRKTAHQTSVLHQSSPCGGSGQQLVVVEGVEPEQGEVSAYADIGQRK